MSSYTYTSTELGSVLDNRLCLRLSSGGYTCTHISVIFNGAEQEVEITVIDVVDRSILLTALTATEPTIALSVNSLSIIADGTTTANITVTDSRGSAASGKIIALSWEGLAPVSTMALTLDGAGQGTVTFGPTTLRTSQPITVAFSSEELPSLNAEVSFI